MAMAAAVTAGEKVFSGQVCMDGSVGCNANTIGHCFNSSKRLKIIQHTIRCHSVDPRMIADLDPLGGHVCSPHAAVHLMRHHMRH